MDKSFRDEMTAGYALDEPSIVIGSPMLEGELYNEARVQVALSMMNRHGLIAGATGTGKTKTLQLLAGELSKAGVPVFISDIKGDVSGMAAPGDAANPKVQERVASLGWTFEPSGHPVELLSLSGLLGAQVRATVSSFGPLLLGKVLDLNETQTSILSLIFKYCDDNHLPLLDLADLATTLKYLASDEGKPILDEYGGMSSASVGVLLRSIIVLEQEGVDAFFGEPEFQVPTCSGRRPTARASSTSSSCRTSWTSPGCLDVHALDARPAVRAPARGRRPAEAEARLLLRRGPSPLRRRVRGAHGPDRADGPAHPLEGRRRLLRHPGADRRPVVRPGPARQPDPARAPGVHARRRRRAAQDRPDIPDDRAYDVEKTLTSLGIGEALVTVLSPRGVPTPLAATRVLPPDSLMAPLPPADMQARIAASLLATKYATAVDRESAHEMISGAHRRGPGCGCRRGCPGCLRDRVSPTSAGGLDTMTPAQQQREIARQARAMAAAEKAAERQRR